MIGCKYPHTHIHVDTLAKILTTGPFLPHVALYYAVTRNQMTSLTKQRCNTRHETKTGETMATLAMRLSDELKSDATEVAEYYGFDLGSITRAFYTQMVRERSNSAEPTLV